MVPMVVVKVILGVKHRVMTLSQIHSPDFTSNFERMSFNIAQVSIKLVIHFPQPLKVSLLRLQTGWFIEGHFPISPDERP